MNRTLIVNGYTIELDTLSDTDFDNLHNRLRALQPGDCLTYQLRTETSDQVWFRIPYDAAVVLVQTRVGNGHSTYPL